MSVRAVVTGPVFVGRAEELAVVRAVVDRACDGRASALLIRGGAGVGKTELVSRALQDAEGRATVARGAALPLTSMTVPFLALRTALTRLPSAHRPTPFTVFDETEPAEHAPPAFDGWVTERCHDHPLVLVIDDLHWADESTLDVLMYLLSGPADRPLATVLTVRHGEVGDGHPLNRWLAHVRRLPGFELMTLQPFDRSTSELQVAGLLGAPPHQSLVDDIFAQARGNAYLIRLLVTGVTPDSRRLPDALPTDLEGALLASWHQLSSPARHLTTVVAIGGRRVSSTELAKVVTGDDAFADVTSRLREAMAAGVLDMASDGTYWFRHPLQAQVLAHRMPDDERRFWHTEFAARLEGLVGADAPADVETLASIADHHYRAEHAGDAFAWALRAAAAAGASGGIREQVRLLRRALDVREHTVSFAPTRLELLLALKDAAAKGGDHESELDAVEELLATTSDASDPLLRAELLVRRCHLRFSTGRAFLSLDDVDRARHLSSEQPHSWQHALALAEMAHVGVWADDPRAADFAERGIVAARRAGHPRALAYALTSGAMLATIAGRDEEGRALADEGRRAAIEAKDFWAYVHASLWEVNCVAPFTSEQGTALAAQRRRELQALAAPHTYVAWLASDEALGWVSQGRWELATEPLRIALGTNPGGLVDVKTRLVAARLAAFQGRVEEALGHMQRADELCESSAFLPLESDAVRAEVLLAAGDPEAALASALRGATLPGAPPTLCERLVPLAARSLAELVEDARAHGSDVELLLARVEDLGRRFPGVIADIGADEPAYRAQLVACAAWYAAELGRARSDLNNAQAWEDLVRLANAAALPWDAAYAGLQAALAHLRTGPGHRQVAAELLRTSHRLAMDLAAQPTLEAVRRLATAARLSLQEVEPGQRPSIGYALPGLTRREQEILAHIVAGRTYSEIARDLVVSEKTVSSHVSNMLRKCGAINRVELAQLAARQT